MYKIKQLNEDFVVEEQFDISSLLAKEGPVQYFLLEKNGLGTSEAIFLLSQKLQIPRKNFGYAGAKDKRALTRQHISIITDRDIGVVQSDRMSLAYLGKGERRINLGSHQGNKFKITVRNIEPEFLIENEGMTMMPNYFGEQRFSSGNFEAGMAILKKDFSRAAAMIAKMYSGASSGGAGNFLKAYYGDQKNPAMALQQLDRKILMMFVHSVQSQIFNRLLSRHIEKNYFAYKTINTGLGDLLFPEEAMEADNPDLPLIGFGTDLDDCALGDEAAQILSEMGLNTRMFIIREIPKLSSEGSTRKAFARIGDLSVSALGEDELNDGKLKCTAEFSLPNGSYATVALLPLFGQ